MPRPHVSDPDCAIAQAAAVIGDWWSLLIVRDVAGGVHRFDALQTELQVSRKVLAERLRDLVGDGILERRAYQDRPARFEYHLTATGAGLLPVLVAMQTWGTQHLLGDGTVTATGSPDGSEAHRLRALVGRPVPELELAGSDGAPNDPVSPNRWTVLYGFPGAYAPGDNGYPSGWDRIPGARGCTLEARTFRDLADEFTTRHADVRGVSTQRPDQLANFAEHEALPYALLSDTDLRLAATLRLPTFRAGGAHRLKRVTLVVDADRIVRDVHYPVRSAGGAVRHALTSIDRLERPARR